MVVNSRQDTAIQGGIAQYVKYVNIHFHKFLIVALNMNVYKLKQRVIIIIAIKHYLV